MLCAGAALWLMLAGCSKSEEGSYYEARPVASEAPVEKAVESAAGDALPHDHPPLNKASAGTQAPAGGMGAGSLSPDMVGRGQAPGWTLPEGWIETETQPMRRSNFSLAGGDLEVAVTAFPGNVGGLPANINRWRSQLGLPPQDPSAMQSYVTELQVDGRGVLVVDLLGPPQPNGPTQRMLTAVTFYQGSSWFFKMAGDASKVEQHRPAYLEFVQSLKFAETSSTAPL
jgi:hypothetical protein